MRILVSDALERACIELLQNEGFEVENAPGTKPARLLEIIGDYDALVVRSATKVTAEVLGRADRLKVIGRAGTGVDNIDVDAATRRGILVMNTPGGNTVSTAEHTVAMLLSLARNIPQAHRSLTAGEWEKNRYVGMEVFEKTVGIIGLGKIGREVAARCRALGMQVVAYDPVLSGDVAARMQIQLVGLDDLYRRSDFITVHTPLNAETRGLLNDTTFGKCKRGVRVINCARGGIIDEAALLRALASGQAGGAALDVFETEPPVGNPLVGHPNVVVTPHLGASTGEAQGKVAVQIAHQIADILKGRAAAGIVNSMAVQTGVSDELRPYVDLAGRMGSFVAQMLEGKLESLTLAMSGDAVSASMELLKAAALKGLLSRVLPEPINLINAPLLAADMGVRVSILREEAEGPYAAMIRLLYATSGREREVGGTVFGKDTIRFVRLDGFRCEVRPEGVLLVYTNPDRPGILAKVGTILAAHQVNIAGVSLARSALGAAALTIMNLDSPIPPGALEELRKLQSVGNLRPVTLG